MAKRAAKKKARQAAKQGAKKAVNKAGQKPVKKAAKKVAAAMRRTAKPLAKAKRTKRPVVRKKKPAKAANSWPQLRQALLRLPQTAGELWQLESVPFDEEQQAVVLFVHDCGPECDEDHEHHHAPEEGHDAPADAAAEGEEEAFELHEVNLTWRMVVAEGATGNPLYISGGDEPPTVEEAWACLLDAMQTPRQGAARRPAKLQVGAEELQPSWGRKLQGLGIELEIVVDLGAVAEGYQRSLQADEPMSTLKGKP